MHIERSTIRLASLALSVALSATGCATVQGVTNLFAGDPKERDERDVKAAYDAGDLERLAQMCSEKIELRSREGRDMACRAERELAYEQFKALEDCDAVTKTVEEQQVSGKEFAILAASKLARCGKWDHIFVEIVHRDPTEDSQGGPDALAALTKEGYDIEKEFLAFLERHKDKPMSFKYSDFAVGHLTDWFKENRPPESCQPLVPYAEKMEEGTQMYFYWYFAESKCMSALGMMTRALASNSVGVRRAACRHLGTLGDPSVLDKLRILADNDPAYEVKEEKKNGDILYHKVYPVRAACADAVNKIALRAGT